MFNFKKNLLKFLTSFLFLIFIWVMIKIIFSPPEYILPSPTRIIGEIVTNYKFYLYHSISTLLSTIIGLSLGVIIGAFLSFISVLFLRSKPFLETFAVILRTLPIVAIAPIIILWFGTGRLSQIVIVILICFFPIYSSFLRGMERAEAYQIKLFQLFNASKIQIFFHLQLPTSIPYFLNSFPLSVTLAVLGALVAEFTGYDKGLGSLVLRGLYRLDALMLFSANILASLMGIVLYLISFLLEIPFKRYIINKKIVENSGGQNGI